MLSAGTVIEGGIKLVREQPMAVATWALIYLLLTIGMTFAMRPFMDPQTLVESGAAFVGPMLLLQLLALVVYLVLTTAALRAVLRPREGGFAFLGLGMDELRVIGVTLILAIVFYFGLAIFGLLMVGVILAASSSGGDEAAALAVVPIVLLMLPIMIWLAVRFSLATPLTLLRGKIVIGESWRLTKGHFWSLLGGYLVVFVIILFLSLLAGLVTSGSYFASLLESMGNPQATEAAMQAQLAQLGEITPLTMLGWILTSASGALTVALGSGAVATAARELTGDRDAIAETFA